MTFSQSSLEFRYLQSYAETTVGIPFSASGMDETSIDFLAEELRVPFLKVGSGDVNNLRLIKRAALKQRFGTGVGSHEVKVNL